MSKRAALVKIIRGDVEGVIVADAFDYPPRGYALIELPEDSLVSAGWQWDETANLVPPQKIAVVEGGIVKEITEARYFDPAPEGMIKVDDDAKVGDAADAVATAEVTPQ